MSGYCIGVDVGSEHVAAGLFDPRGCMLARVARPLIPSQPEPGFVEQSSAYVWQQCCDCVQAVLVGGGVPASQVEGLGFASTGSVVALDAAGAPCSLAANGDPSRNVLLDLDQRAAAEAEIMNAMRPEAVSYAGGAVTAEHALARMLWVKRNRPEQYQRVGLFLDLSEYLVYRAIGEPIRSRAVIGCHWLYQTHEDRWPEALLCQLGLDDLLAEQRLGTRVGDTAAPAGCLTSEAAAELGLTTKTVVATGLIDACAGGIGLLGSEPVGKLALVAGPSACHLAASREPVFAEGLGGPVKGALTTDHWVTHAGQSAFGALLDYVISDSAGYPELLRGCERTGCKASDLLRERVEQLESREENPTRSLHVLDYHHGSRAPRSDQAARGMVTGLTMDQDVDALARRYLATIQALCYGTRYIADVMRDSGHDLDVVRVCGQLADNPLWCRELADATGLRLELPPAGDPLLRGSALSAAVAAGRYDALADAMAATEGEPEVIEPRRARSHFHDTKYQVYRRLYDDQTAYRELMGRV